MHGMDPYIWTTHIQQEWGQRNFAEQQVLQCVGDIFVQPVSVYCSIDCPLSHLAPRAHTVSIDDHIHVTPRDHPAFILTNGLLSTPQIQHINQVTSWPDNTAWFLDHSNKIDIYNISSAMAKRVKSVKSYRTTCSSRFSVGKCALRPIHFQYILSNLMNKGWSLTMPVRYLVLPNIEISTGQPWSILKYYVSTTVPILNYSGNLCGIKVTGCAASRRRGYVVF